MILKFLTQVIKAYLKFLMSKYQPTAMSGVQREFE